MIEACADDYKILDVLKDRRTSLASRLKVAVMHQLVLQRAKETLRNRGGRLPFANWLLVYNSRVREQTCAEREHTKALGSRDF